MVTIRGGCMDSVPVRWLRWDYVVMAVGLFGGLVEHHADAASSQKAKPQVAAAAVGRARDVRSAHFLIHTDLPPDEANRLAERLETLLRHISSYWGRPLQGVIECYVVRDLDTFPVAGMDPRGVLAIRDTGGMNVIRSAPDGARSRVTPTVYADGRPEVVQHEVVHAYCHHVFGRTGPVWYAEGMAEMGHYWAEGDTVVHADAREIAFLRAHPPKTLTEALSPHQVSGDSWENYAARWALCHFLTHAPNYGPQFMSFGRGLLTGQNVCFERTYGAMAHELSFEYTFFLNHMAAGYCLKRTAWDWNRKFATLGEGRAATMSIAAGHGWQPTGLTVSAGAQYQYVATGKSRIGGAAEVDANGDAHGRGRLVGILLNNYQLGPEFELGAEGSLQLATGGDLYLRCRNAWNELAADSGRLAVKLKHQGRNPRG